MQRKGGIRKESLNIVHTPCHGAFPFCASPYQKHIIFSASFKRKRKQEDSLPGCQEREQIDEQSTENLQRLSSRGQAVFKRYIRI